METISVKGVRYYQLNDIIEHHLDFAYGISSNVKILEKNNVPDDEYIYAIKKNGKWIKMKNESNNNKILIGKQWFKDNYDFENETKNAPDILEIEDEEMFVDETEGLVEIKMYGEREIDKCYFLAEDIGRVLSSKTTVHNITNDSRKDYKINKHYVYFYVQIGKTGKRKKKLFLTYKCLMQLFRNSRKQIAKDYVEWADKTLFTIKHGTTDSKVKLVSEITGASSQNVKILFRKFVKATSCIYLFTLGTVGDLRTSLDISEDFDDKDIVIKWGRTKNIHKRTTKHEKTYGKIKGVTLTLEIAGWIDAAYLVEAEAIIKKYMIKKNYVINTTETKFEELGAISKNKFKPVRDVYTEVTDKYAGSLADIKDENMSLKKDVEHNKNLIISKDETIKSKDETIELLRDKIKTLEKSKTK